MKLKELIEKLDENKIIYINGQQYKDNIDQAILEKEIIKIDIKIKEESKKDLESLGYSFEVGM
ncbi:hypothetical protein [Tissierella pigra]|uniref:Uncharacterized protein n=1 Tax=Tissierella pigra TaxID=2607614 RepID=A0A6N7XZV5_9FIRM|nr:hypothetical protein [Tissierella pigra]MSU02134.1 hypothetical protein [Tissierella pigra]